MFTRHIGATGVYDLTDGDEFAVSCVEFTLTGFSGSLIPQMKQMTDGPAPVTEVYFDCTYINANTGTSYAAGTAITSDGRFLVNSTGAKLGLNVGTAGPAFWVTGKPFIGTAFISSTGGGGGGGGAVTIAEGADVSEGTTLDAAVLAGGAGTVISQLKGLNTVLSGTAYNGTDGLLRIELVKDSTPIPTTALPVVVQDSTMTFTLPTGDVAARSINTKVTDGTNTMAVKAASTAPVAADPAAVVSISPNSLLTSASTLTGLSLVLPVASVSSTHDGANQRRNNSANTLTDANAGNNTPTAALVAYNAGANAYDRVRVSTADAVTSGLLGVGVFGFNGTTNDRIRGSLGAGLVVKPYALPANDVFYPAPSGGITTTTAVTIAAAVASNKTYLTSLQLSNTGAAGTEVIIRRATGAVVIWRGSIGANASGVSYAFRNPLASATNDALELVLSSGTTVAVYPNTQGFTAP